MHKVGFHKDFNTFFYNISKNGQHTSLTSGIGITQPEWHPSISKYTIRSCEGNILLVFRIHCYLIFPQVAIQEPIKGLSSQPLQHLVHEWKKEVILPCGIIEFAVIDAHPPADDGSFRDEIILIIADYHHGTLFWDHLHQTHPSRI